MMRFFASALVVLGLVCGPATYAFPGEVEFLRGDIDGDGVVIPFADAHYLLNFAAAPGSPPLPCDVAADVDDDGVVNGTLDGLALLKWAYRGDDAPPSPGPDECGPDPDDSDLDCDTTPPCDADPPTLDTDDAYCFTISEGYGQVGDLALVTLSFTNDGFDVMALEVAVCHDSEVVSIGEDDIVAVEEFETIFQATEIRGEEGWTLGLVMDPHFGLTIDADGEERILYEMTYEILADEDSDLELCGILDETLVEPRVLLADGELALPELVNGSIRIAEFMRGDVDGSGSVLAITDALAILQWGFSDGDEPGCMAAADVDDDGTVFPILDAIYLLNWGFTGGEAPPDPGPTDCGTDPTEDSVSCTTVTKECQ